MTEPEKKQLKAAMEKKQEELIRSIVDLKEVTKPMGVDNAIGELAEWII